MPVLRKSRDLGGVAVAILGAVGSLAAAFVGCDAPAERGPWTLSGAVTRYGRLSHAGIRVVVEPNGPETFTDAHGGWILTGAPDGDTSGVALRFESPGFAPEVRRAWNAGEQSPLVLYRGRNVPLPAELVVVAAEEVPPAGLLLTGEGGERLLVDLEIGAVSLSLGADWRPSSQAVDGYVVGIDAITGEVSDPPPTGGAGGFTPRGALSAGGERQGMVLSRPIDPSPDALNPAEPPSAQTPQEVVYWVPGAEPIAFPEPVLALGPPLRLTSGDESMTLLLAEGWVHWKPGAGAEVLAPLDVATVSTVTPLFAPQGAGSTLCYAWGEPGSRAVDCVRTDVPAHTVATLPAPAVDPGAPEAEPMPLALVSADPPLLVWRDPTLALCRATLADGVPMAAAFPCQPSRVTAHALGDSVVFQDARGALHRLGPSSYTELGPGKALTGGHGRLGYLADGERLTLLREDGTRHTAAEPCSPDSSVHVAGQGLLAIDPVAKRAVHLADDGRSGVVPMLSADLRAAVKPERISRNDEVIGLAGAQGFVRLDLGEGKVFSLVHRGWRFVDFSWPADTEQETTLPEVALIRARDRVRAVDLYTLANEPLGEGNQAGLLSGRAWFVNARGLYIVDDPAAE